MKLELSKFELDLPPEGCEYRDEGCELFRSCLNCPLPVCVYEMPGGRHHWLKHQRDREMVRLFVDEGKRVKELAKSFDVSERTVQRVLKSCLSTPERSGDKNE